MLHEERDLGLGSPLVLLPAAPGFGTADKDDSQQRPLQQIHQQQPQPQQQPRAATATPAPQPRRMSVVGASTAPSAELQTLVIPALVTALDPSRLAVLSEQYSVPPEEIQLRFGQRQLHLFDQMEAQSLGQAAEAQQQQQQDRDQIDEFEAAQRQLLQLSPAVVPMIISELDKITAASPPPKHKQLTHSRSDHHTELPDQQGHDGSGHPLRSPVDSSRPFLARIPSLSATPIAHELDSCARRAQ